VGCKLNRVGRRNAWVGPACIAALLCVAPVEARSESLLEALGSAYQINPLLSAERARQRATDEEIARAKATGRPVVFGDADIAYEYQRTTIRPGARNGGGADGPVIIGADGQVISGGTGAFSGAGNGSASDRLVDVEENRPRGYGIQFSQPIFRGFRTKNAIRQADANILSGRETLRLVEQNTLLDGVVVYMDVVRDQAIVRLRENNVNVLSEQLKATQDRFDVGEVTRTDVAQAEARRAGAISELNLAQAQLKASRAAYERVIGHAANGVFNPPSISHLLPYEIQEAVNIGDVEHPQILSQVYLEQASLHNVNLIEGELLPEVTLEGRYQERFGLSDSIDSVQTATVVGRLSVPLYQAGDVAARVRQAKEVNFQRQREVENARLEVNAASITAFGNLSGARATIVSARSQRDANQVALTGVREEARVGQRTVLDVLNAEQELLNSQVLLVTAERDTVVAEFSLLAAIGRLNPPTIGVPAPYYDPGAHYHAVKNKWFGLSPNRTFAVP
jgi:outer membrane protein